MRINDAILAAFGGTWDNPPTLPEGWVSDPQLNASREEAGKVVADLAARGFWGWKDPRTCLTLPFWQELVPNMSVVLCVRHPFEVAQSLAGRRESYVPRGRAMNLWQASYAAAIVEISDLPHVVTRYVSFFYDTAPSSGGYSNSSGTPRRKNRSPTPSPRSIRPCGGASVWTRRSSRTGSPPAL
ncbi:hypothetical protein BH11ARM2_BH11ARM2_23490 [soil metagenome]